MRLTSADYSEFKLESTLAVRLLAGFLDLLIFLVFLLVIWSIEFAFDVFIPEQIGFVAYVIYCVVFQWRFGRTFGKYHTDLCITNMQGEAISLAQSINRMAWHWIYIFLSVVIAKFLESTESGYEMGPIGVGLVYLVFLLLMVFVYAIDHFAIVVRNDRRALHDLVAETKVMRK